jgi:hypothetical protein
MPAYRFLSKQMRDTYLKDVLIDVNLQVTNQKRQLFILDNKEMQLQAAELSF